MTALDGLPGRVVLPGDAGYESARTSWNRLFTHRPAAIVYVQSTQDAVEAVAWARYAGMPLRVRSGGHCLEGWSTLDDGLVIDVSELTSVAVDPNTRVAVVGAGLTQLAAVEALGESGFAAPTGTEGSVGLVGATLGGGFGLLTRALGMACDNLLNVEIVVASADGGAEAITVDADNHAELLWALRGAGNGSFGVVTSLTYTVHPITRAISVKATWPGLEHLSQVFDVWQRTAPETDERLTSQLELTRDSVVLFAVIASGEPSEDEPGIDPEQARRMLDPLLSIGDPEVTVTDEPWAKTYREFQIPLDDEPANWKFSSQFVSQPFPSEALEIIGTFLAAAPSGGCNYFTNAFGGAVAHSEPRGGSAFAHRDALFYAEPGAGWGIRGGTPAADDPLTEACLEWVADVAAALARFVQGAYSNVPNADAPDWETDYWGAGAARLRAIKSSYDPTGVFSFEQSIPTGS
jgi:FAD/FMN-containing dehydrogenase